MPDLTTIYIRNVPAPLRRKVRSQAAAMDLTLAEWLERAALGVELSRSITEHILTDEVPDWIMQIACNVAPKGEE